MRCHFSGLSRQYLTIWLAVQFMPLGRYPYSLLNASCTPMLHAFCCLPQFLITCWMAYDVAEDILSAVTLWLGLCAFPFPFVDPPEEGLLLPLLLLISVLPPFEPVLELLFVFMSQLHGYSWQMRQHAHLPYLECYRGTNLAYSSPPARASQASGKEKIMLRWLR